jgi:hypothetical protein
VLKGVPEMPREMPPGIVVLPTGPYPTLPGETRLVPEFFYQEAVPPPEVLRPPPPPVAPTTPLPEQTVPATPGAAAEPAPSGF